MAAQNNSQYLNKESIKIIPKEPTHFFNSSKPITNYQRTRNQPTFVSAQSFDKKKILTVYNSPYVEIKSITKEKPIHQLLISPQPRSFSTASFTQTVLVSF